MSAEMKILGLQRAAVKYGKAAVALWPKTVPFYLLSEQWAQHNHYQTLTRLNERGGLSPAEMLANIEHRKWISMDENDAALKIAKIIAAHKG